MRIGSFAAPDQVERLGAAGADYVELFATRTLIPGDHAQFLAFRSVAMGWPVAPEAFAGLLPAELRLCGPTADPVAQDAYLDELFSRIVALTGGKRVVATIGSAGARQVPPGFDIERAREQIASFLLRAGPKADAHGVTLALEHLNRHESNIFNTLADCGSFIEGRRLPNVHLIVDLYHLMEEAEPLSVIERYGSQIVHAHVADTNRDAPGTGDYPFAEFFGALRKAGYDGNCSIEAFWTDFDNQVDRALRTVRRAAASAGYDS